jgi:Ca-activated chloride channel family protein
MSFAFPAIFIAPIVYVLVRLLSRKRETASVAVPSISMLRGLPVSARVRLRIPTLLVLEGIIITSLTIAAARPQRVTIVEQPTLARNIMLVIDTSNSMSGEDFPTKLGATSRMEGVKTVVAEYVRSRHGDRVGLVVFGNTSYLQSPLTSDTQLVEKLVEQLQPRMAGDGTAIGDGLGLALKRLKDVEGRSKAIILMTDGVNTAGQVSPLKAAQIAREFGVQIHTIGIGTGSVSLAQGAFGGLLGGRAGPVADFDEATLKEIARLTGGVYFNATSLEGFKEVYRQIDALDQTEQQQPEKPIIHELFAPWALVGLLSLFLSLVLQLSIFRRFP